MAASLVQTDVSSINKVDQYFHKPVRTQSNNLSKALEALKAANILTKDIQFAKVILAGEVKSAVTVRGLRVTKGAKAAIEAAGGKIEE